jgi:hypothetical protein
MAKSLRKQDFPVGRAHQYLEPGPIVLAPSQWRGKNNIMTLGWHTILEFTPSLVGCMISGGNHSHDMIRRSGDCVINLPTTALTNAVVGVGNTSGSKVDLALVVLCEAQHLLETAPSKTVSAASTARSAAARRPASSFCRSSPASPRRPCRPTRRSSAIAGWTTTRSSAISSRKPIRSISRTSTVACSSRGDPTRATPRTSASGIPRAVRRS